MFQCSDVLINQEFKFPPNSEPESGRNNNCDNPIQEAISNQRQRSATNLTPRPTDYTLIKPLYIAAITANGGDKENKPENVLDGNPRTAWTNKGTDSWILLDHGSSMDIHSIEVAWYLGSLFDYHYEISISNDGTEFRNVKSRCSGGPLWYKLKAVTLARYVKIAVMGNNMNDRAGISQVKVMGHPGRKEEVNKDLDY